MDSLLQTKEDMNTSVLRRTKLKYSEYTQSLYAVKAIMASFQSILGKIS